MNEKEATGGELNLSVSLFGERDFARMEGAVKLRKEYQDLSRKLGEPNRKPGTGKKKISKKTQCRAETLPHLTSGTEPAVRTKVRRRRLPGRKPRPNLHEVPPASKEAAGRRSRSIIVRSVEGV